MKSKKILIIIAIVSAGIILAVAAIWRLGLIESLVTKAQNAPQQEDREHLEGNADHGIQEAYTEHGEEAEGEDSKEHEEHDGQGGHDEGKVVRLDEAEMKEFGIEVGTAESGNLQMHVSLPGEVAINADRRAHMVPRVPGIVRQVRKNLGDYVHTSEVMAVLESRELADLKSAYLAAKERVALTEANFRREEDLWKKKISAEKDYLEAKQALAEARIELRSAEQKLHAIGFSEKYLAQLSGHPDIAFTRYQLVAPFSGTVIEKHIVLGEVLKDDTEAYVVADLSTVWVNLNVYQKDLPFVRKGQPVIISAGHGIPDAQGEISYVGPLVGEQTRTALARVVLPNPEGHWRPGLFVTGKITVENLEVPLLVPKTALQTVEDKLSVFIKTEGGFKPQPVTVGRTNETHVEITSGLTPGQEYVMNGAFTLKAQLSKGTFGDGHAH